MDKQEAERAIPVFQITKNEIVGRIEDLEQQLNEEGWTTFATKLYQLKLKQAYEELAFVNQELNKKLVELHAANKQEEEQS